MPNIILPRCRAPGVTPHDADGVHEKQIFIARVVQPLRQEELPAARPRKMANHEVTVRAVCGLGCNWRGVPNTGLAVA